MAFPWQDLQVDIKLEILSRLPPKSLLRFKCVSKSWLSLFSDPSFIHKHLLHRNSVACGDDNETLLIHGNAPGHYNFSLVKLKNPSNPITFNLNHPFPEINDLWDMHIVGSIDGLVCLTSGQQTDGSMLILWNPATQQYTNIPTPKIEFPKPGGRFTIGFCFDSLRYDYKMVRLVWSLSCQFRPPPRAEVYSITADCWREIEVEIPFDFVYFRCDTIVRGEPYWAAQFYSSEKSSSFYNVVWFDACEEVFRQSPPLALGLPHTLVNGFLNFRNSASGLGHTLLNGVANFRNSVAVLVTEMFPPEIEHEWKTSLWVLEEESSSWSMKFRAGFPCSNELVGCSKNGEIVFHTKDMHVLQLYSPKTEETSNIQIDLESKVGIKYHFRLASGYTASIVPIKKSKQVEKIYWWQQSPYFNTAKATTSADLSLIR